MSSSYYDTRITALQAQYTEFEAHHPQDEPEDAKGHDLYIKRFIDILCGLTSILREAEATGCAKEEFDALVARIDGILQTAMDFAYDEDGLYRSEGYMPSFAHVGGDEGMIQDVKQGTGFSHGLLSEIIPFFQTFMRGDKNPAAFLDSFKPPPAWSKTLRPHPASTPCSRFRDVIPNWDPTFSTSHPRATAVFEAHCEITCDDIALPSDMVLSPSNNVLVVTTMGGYKNRVPYMHCFMTKDTSNINEGGFMKSRNVKLDLMDIVTEVLIDEGRNLIFVGDRGRAKSYAWENGKRKMKRVHTMDTGIYTGPMAVLSNGCFVRGGEGLSVGVWDIDSLETHGASGKEIIGGKMDSDEIDTWRDDPEDIELSKGSQPSRSFNFEIENGRETHEEVWVLDKWSKHPSLGGAGTMLCALGKAREAYHCRAVDLEAGGRTVMQYLGHGGHINGFSTSTGANGPNGPVGGDPNVFLTACEDGYARLYDVRQVLPVMTINSTTSSDGQNCAAAVLAHPDGIPFIFTGATNDEDVKVWDVRAKAIVYDLATGNNAVDSMAWDADENSLYVATTCPYVDRLGGHMNYRRAKIPKKRAEGEKKNEEEDEKIIMDEEEDEGDWEDEDEDDEDDDEEEDKDDDICWPKRAYHSENYYGDVFDAGEHRIYKVLFKMDADPQVVPYYGSASVGGGNWW